MAPPPIVPDLLAPGLDLVFCGSAPSRASAEAKAYYANPGNRFWLTLHETGLTPRLFAPREYPKLLDLGIGLTDVWKFHFGQDAELPKDGANPPALEAKILLHQPKWLAFTSKNSARTALGGKVGYGIHPRTIGPTRIYVCCSTSGLARSFWDIRIWQDLADLVLPGRA
jgi:TDG/mug DNA glycosylase family protein